MYTKCNLAELSNRRKVHLRNYMFKIKNDKNNLNIINEEIHMSTRLHDGPVFNVTHPNSEPIKRSVMYSGAIEWNSLDADVRNIREFIQFKRIQKSWMLKTFLD